MRAIFPTIITIDAAIAFTIAVTNDIINTLYKRNVNKIVRMARVHMNMNTTMLMMLITMIIMWLLSIIVPSQLSNKLMLMLTLIMLVIRKQSRPHSSNCQPIQTYM